MVNEDFYKSMSASLAEAKRQLAAAKDLMDFATLAGMPIKVDAATVSKLQAQVNQMETALASRGYPVS